MHAKEEQKQRKELEATLKLIKNPFPLNLYDKCKQDLEEILWKEYASEAGVSGMKKVRKIL